MVHATVTIHAYSFKALALSLPDGTGSTKCAVSPQSTVALHDCSTYNAHAYVGVLLWGSLFDVMP